MSTQIVCFVCLSQVLTDMAPVILVAILHGNYELVRFLLEAGTNVNEVMDGTTALVLATEAGDKRMVEVLLDYGARINFSGGGRTALIAACQLGYNDLIHVLLRRGARVNKSDCNGTSPLGHMVHCHHDPYNISMLLLKHGANPNQVGAHGSPLMSVCRGREDKKTVIFSCKRW